MQGVSVSKSWMCDEVQRPCPFSSVTPLPTFNSDDLTCTLAGDAKDAH